GHTNNMMHPAISELIFRIVHKPHKSEDSLAKSLPEEFGVYTGELVAAVVLFLQVGLQEYATGQFLKVRFTEENYHKTYKDALRSIAKLKGNREHWGKTTARWAQWEAEHTIEVGTPNANAEGMNGRELRRTLANYMELRRTLANYMELRKGYPFYRTTGTTGTT
ncbi:hypothetical protein C8F04DRAFT_1197829, partial [Mycena alexandri]